MISGAKRFITNAPVAGLFVVFARTREAAGADPGIAVFLVPAGTPGSRSARTTARWATRAPGPPM